MHFAEVPSQDRIDRFQEWIKKIFSGIAFFVAIFFLIRAGKAVVTIYELRLQKILLGSYFVRSITEPFTIGMIFLVMSIFLFWRRHDKTPHYYDPRSYEKK